MRISIMGRLFWRLLPVLLICLPHVSYSQALMRLTPPEEEFIRYLEQKQGHSFRYTPRGHILNYAPNHVRVDFRATGQSNALKSMAAVPEYFDLRDSSLVTSPKDQGTGEAGGNCAAFATMGALESVWLKMDGTARDLSEQNQAACYGFEWPYGDGATRDMPAAYLTRFDGPVTETDDPYNTDIQTCKSSITPVAYAPEVRWLPRDTELIKRKLMNFGAMVVSVFIDGSLVTDEKMAENNNGYYYSGNEEPNHVFLLCGWDDDRETPGGTGAWIIKNSWGDDWADNGFLYVSYNDSKALTDISFYPYRWATEEVDQLHMYDDLGVVYRTGLRTTGSDFDYGNGLVRFRASSEQLITRIGTYTMAAGTMLDIEVYRNFDGKKLTDTLASKQDIYVKYPGYHSFDLPFTVSGDFFVKVRYYTPGIFDPMPIEAEATDGEGQPWADPELQKDVCWYGYQDTVWQLMDTIENPANLCIRAYGRLTSKVSATVSADKRTSCLNSDVSFSAVTTGDISSWEWDFGKAATPASATGPGPHAVSYSTPGAKHVTLRVNGETGPETTLYNAVEIVDQISIDFERDSIVTPSRLEVELKAFGADDYAWTGEHLNQTAGGIVTTTPPGEGTFLYTVTGTQGDCEATAQLKLISKPRPENDDVCEAFEITPSDQAGLYTNVNATVEFNEPAPPTGPGGCTSPLMWCTEAEGKLQHTVWFWFTGPGTNLASIDTRGFDNQIAVYKAESCEDILSGNYFLAAANDDYYPAELQNAAALEAFLALEGQKYFVQVDGSFGGQEGEFTLRFNDYDWVGREYLPDDHDRMFLYPNPTVGQFTLQINKLSSPQFSVEVFNSNGQLIIQESHYHDQEDFTGVYDLSDQVSGVYHMRVVTDGKATNLKIIRQ